MKKIFFVRLFFLYVTNALFGEIQLLKMCKALFETNFLYSISYTTKLSSLFPLSQE